MSQAGGRLGAEPHGDVCGFDRMRQAPTGNAVNGNVADLFSAFDGDIAGNFDEGTVADEFARLFHRLGGHVVEHEDIRARLESLPDFVQRCDLDLNAQRVRRGVTSINPGLIPY